MSSTGEKTPNGKTRRANIYSVPASKPFLSALAAALLDGHLPCEDGAKPTALDLADITLYMPTRRAARALSDAFLAANKGGTLILPSIRPISEGHEDLTLLSQHQRDLGDGAIAADIAPAIGEAERRLALTELVLAWSRTRYPDESFSPAQASNLAAELCRLMDLAETENVRLDGLADLATEALAEHWQETVKFLEIITNAWPAHLAERKSISATQRRNELILAEAERLRTTPSSGPVIVAGVTGSVPATTELMRAVLQLDNGAIVLPGLDHHLDPDSWQAIHPSDVSASSHYEHPQFGFSKLLNQLEISRDDVTVLKGSEPSLEETGRLKFISEVMRPTQTTAKWHQWTHEANATKVASNLSNISKITAPSAQDEAEVIALILRETAEIPGRTAALVSPDRFLARRVAIRLEAWGIRVDDSAGRPFAKTVVGTFLDLVIDCIAKDFAPAEVISLLKHPLTRLGMDAFSIRRTARALELIVFRTTYLGKGLDGLTQALASRIHDLELWTNPEPTDDEQPLEQSRLRERPHNAALRLWEEDRIAASALVQKLIAAFQPLSEFYNTKGPQKLSDIITAHLRVGDALTKLPEDENNKAETSPLYEGEAGEAAAQFFADMLDPSLRAPDIAAHDYADLYRSLIQSENIRPNVPVHPRLSIWGPFESRLQQPDVVVLGSLNDGTWPGAADPGPWLNRPMRKQLGLPAPEEALGRAAHDFTCLLAAKRVYLTRAEKVDGVPTVPSRWLMRIEALTDGLDISSSLEPKRPWLAWARERDKTLSDRIPKHPPAPRPPVTARPRRISVSGIESWIANPYSIFARYILALSPLPSLGEAASVSLKGTVIHEALARFADRYPKILPEDTERTLLEEIQTVLRDYSGDTRIAAFWVPRFERFANWFAETEGQRRIGLAQTFAEQSGRLTIEAPAGPFSLTARADRIDYVDHKDGTPPHLIITDYKTGTPPSDARVKQGLHPQLPLEAVIANNGGFPSLPDVPVMGLAFISASGGDQPGAYISVVDGDCRALGEEMQKKLTDLVAAFDNPQTPYQAKRRRRFDGLYRYDDYAHLARVAEWSMGTDGGGDG